MLPGMPPPREEQIKELERLGESEVRYLLVTEPGHHRNFEWRVAEEWLRQKGEERERESSARRDERESEMLKIAKKASSDARSARIIALIAAAIAAITSIITAYIKTSP